MRGRAHRDRLFHRIDADVGFRQFTDKRQTLQQFFLAEVAEIEVDHVAARRRDGVPFPPLVPEGLGHFVAWAQLHIFILRFAERGFRAHAVILQIAVAVFVDQNPAFAAAAFGHQDPGARQAGRVILNEFHVAQRHAMAQGHPHPVTGDDATVGVVAVDAPGAAGSQHHGVSADLHQGAFHHIHRHQAAGLPVIDQQVKDEMFVKALNLGKLKGGLEEGIQHVEAGFVGGKPGAFDFHATEAPDVDAAVGAAAPWASPLLQLGHFRRAVMNKIVDDILLAQPVASRDGVVKMVLKAIVILGNGCGPPFCSDRMAAHRIDFRNQGDFSVGVGLSGGDSGTKACPAGANYGEIGLKSLHDIPPVLVYFAAGLAKKYHCSFIGTGV